MKFNKKVVFVCSLVLSFVLLACMLMAGENNEPGIFLIASVLFILFFTVALFKLSDIFLEKTKKKSSALSVALVLSVVFIYAWQFFCFFLADLFDGFDGIIAGIPQYGVIFAISASFVRMYRNKKKISGGEDFED